MRSEMASYLGSHPKVLQIHRIRTLCSATTVYTVSSSWRNLWSCMGHYMKNILPYIGCLLQIFLYLCTCEPTPCRFHKRSERLQGGSTTFRKCVADALFLAFWNFHFENSSQEHCRGGAAGRYIPSRRRAEAHVASCTL